jgi:hypothetical protein
MGESMPIHDVGYRSWNGAKTNTMLRWWIISKTGVSLAMKSSWVRRILFAAWLPLMYWSVGFFMVEKSLEQDNSLLPAVVEETLNEVPRGTPLAKPIREIKKATANPMAVEQLLRHGYFKYFPQSEQLADAFASKDLQRIRKVVWRWLMMVFFRYPQSIVIVFLVGIVAPALIARDIRSRAFLLYFSRPIGKLEYIFGKLMVPATFIAAVTTLPAIAMYIFAVFMSPDFSVVQSTWDIPLRILLASVTLILPTATLALALSSLTQESRFANFSWFTVWVLGHGSYMAVLLSTSIRMGTHPMDPRVTGNNLVELCSTLSLYNCLGDVQSVVFGFTSLSDNWRSAAVLMLVTAGSMYILYRRVQQATQH